MTQIAAAENVMIDVLPGRWQLRTGDAEHPMAAANGEGFQYSMRFGMTRGLPDTGRLTQADILQVVLGWQQQDQAWHLGLLLAPDLAEARGSRWCELAAWPDPAQTMRRDAAEQAGQALAGMLDVPFYPVEPRGPAVPPAPPPPLPDLPLRFGLWQMEMVEIGEQKKKGVPVHSRQVVIVRTPRWQLKKYMRAGWHVLWAMVYAVVSVATLTSDLALPNAGTLIPNPQWLPYIGLGTSVVLVLIALYALYEAFTRPNVLILDPNDSSISAWRGTNRHWHVSGEEVESIYVSELVKRRSSDPGTEHGEINLHLGEKAFKFVLQQDEPINHAITRDEAALPRRVRDEVLPLRRGMEHTALQGAALHMADILGDVPVWYDMRVK